MCLTVTDGSISEEKCETEELADIGTKTQHSKQFFRPPAVVTLLSLLLQIYLKSHFGWWWSKLPVSGVKSQKRLKG